MSGPGPQTNWEDLSNLGWPRNQAYNAFNARRGGTMEGQQDMALNELFALDWGWYSYNVLIGEPRLAGSGTDHVESSSIVWTYDNSQNLQDFQANWTETWTNTTRASLSITNRSTISLSQSISIMNVANSEFAFTIGTDSTREESRESTHQLSTSWGITVQGGETVHIERVRMITTGQAIYHQDYGLASGSRMATKGRRWDGSFFWGLSMNNALNNPRGSSVNRPTVDARSNRFPRLRARVSR
ncbi:TEER-decreasing protein [Mycena venus]|uniref:TEER-decreasing protein n=1 Tax=Mycena venus TaxID=2733690 RepID=A0A8H6Z181_9AGAR|nr:TEER-decreasing protein [Mycena venus]